MSLSVKDPEAYRLAQKIAKETGATLTQTVIEALREKLERLSKHDANKLADELRAIQQRAAPHIRKPYRDHAELLYDEHGAPK